MPISQGPNCAGRDAASGFLWLVAPQGRAAPIPINRLFAGGNVEVEGTLLYLYVGIGFPHLNLCAAFLELYTSQNLSFTIKDFKTLIDLAKQR